MAAAPPRGAAAEKKYAPAVTILSLASGAIYILSPGLHPHPLWPLLKALVWHGLAGSAAPLFLLLAECLLSWRGRD